MNQVSLFTVTLFFAFMSTVSFAQIFYSENSIKEYWETNGMDNIEGIYESTGSYEDIEVPCKNIYGQTICYSKWRTHATKYKLALVKFEGEYKLIYLSGNPQGTEKIGGCNCNFKTYIEPQSNQWKIGDVKAILSKTATSNFFKCNWYMADKSSSKDGYITFENFAYFTLLLSTSDQDKSMYLKLYPTADSDNKTQKVSGTGFAISSNGIIVTNNHVIEGANTIKVRGINSDFNKIFNAKIVMSDKNNDLALIQIDDNNFTSLGTVPFTIKPTLAGVGENIFVLGYPLRATMGDEIKLTNGIVSSKTGFQGDITSYQISAPVQPGNSGGPLFDNQGNLIGIINAKHVGAENASYAVKSSYLTSLIELLPSPPTLQTVNILTGKSLTQQVQLVKNFVYIIESE
jgi:S1-C subfamily serine protease